MEQKKSRTKPGPAVHTLCLHAILLRCIGNRVSLIDGYKIVKFTKPDI